MMPLYEMSFCTTIEPSQYLYLAETGITSVGHSYNW